MPFSRDFRPATETVAVRRREEIYRLRVGILLGFAAGFLVVAVVEAVRGRAYEAFVAGVITLAELGVAGCFAVWINRCRVELTTTEVVSRNGRTETRVRLSEVLAVVVGGTYRRGWATWLVLDGGRSVRLCAPAFVFHNRMKVYGAAGSAYWRDVAESSTGRQAVLIHAAAGLEDEITSVLRHHSLRGEVTRWWAPSGENSSTTTFG